MNEEVEVFNTTDISNPSVPEIDLTLMRSYSILIFLNSSRGWDRDSYQLCAVDNLMNDWQLKRKNKRFRFWSTRWRGTNIFISPSVETDSNEIVKDQALANKRLLENGQWCKNSW